MLAAFLMRASIDWVRHSEQWGNSNPYSRCEGTIKLFSQLWHEQFGHNQDALLETAIVNAYWQEFFHAEDPLADEKEWREGLTKRSSQYDSFEPWQQWFKDNYVKVYQDNSIWTSILMTAWAHTHQYDVRFMDQSWKFVASRSYLPTSQMWRLEPHIHLIIEIIKEIWLEETRAYDANEFTISEKNLPYLGRLESFGFDTKSYAIIWPPKSKREPENLDLGDMIADIVLPPGDSWYRHLDNIIFTNNCLDITALINRTQYVLRSRRRLLELMVTKDVWDAKMQTLAEGWLVEDLEQTTTTH